MIENYLDLLSQEYPESVLIAADWLEDKGLPEAEGFRQGRLIPEEFYYHFYTFGYGYGDGHGYMNGNGYGNSYGYGDGVGFGYDGGCGDGNGDGYGSVLEDDEASYYSDNRFGEGHNIAIYLYLKNIRDIFEDHSMNDLEIGQAYMWMTGYGWMWVGKYVKPCGLFGAVISDLWNIARAGSTAWNELARGNGRENAIFRKYDSATSQGTPFPYAVPIAKWVGEMPS